MTEILPLAAVVQRNCDVSDARHARGLALCTYLLKMREYFRWDAGLALTETPSRDALGDWVDKRERLWDGLEAEGFACLPLAGDCLDPFDSEPINQRLLPEHLVYSGGYGYYGKPHFFLGRLLHTETHNRVTVYVAGGEYARDLSAPPAMTQGSRIYIRRESLKQVAWGLIEEWRWRQRPGAAARLVAHYGVDADPAAALEQMADDLVSTVMLHEMGEVRAGELLGEDWEQMLTQIGDPRLELAARAVRDNLADALSTLPALAADADPGRLHFYFAALRPLRRELFADAVSAYERWVETGSLTPLTALIPQTRDHWHRAAQRLLRAAGEGESALRVCIEEALTPRSTEGSQSRQ